MNGPTKLIGIGGVAFDGDDGIVDLFDGEAGIAPCIEATRPVANNMA